VEYPTDSSPLPVASFRRHAARVRALARDATTPAIKRRLEALARDYERIADRFDAGGAPQSDSMYPVQDEA
jgi:hypothetical protein